MTTQAVEVGAAVTYTERFGGNKYARPSTSVKFGTVVEIGTGPNEGRVRVLWDRWEITVVGCDLRVKKDGKRTWMRIDRLDVA